MRNDGVRVRVTGDVLGHDTSGQAAWTMNAQHTGHVEGFYMRHTLTLALNK